MRDKREHTSASGHHLAQLTGQVQSHIQHYAEPPASTLTSAPGNASSPSATPALPSISSVYGTGPLLPLGQGTLTLNQAGLPIMVVCTKADLMDSAGDEAGIKGAAWEERTDWVQQVLRTICLSCKLYEPLQLNPS
jgi:dynein light intermediate chain 1